MLGLAGHGRRRSRELFNGIEPATSGSNQSVSKVTVTSENRRAAKASGEIQNCRTP
jgi:hypothetical protein